MFMRRLFCCMGITYESASKEASILRQNSALWCKSTVVPPWKFQQSQVTHSTPPHTTLAQSLTKLTEPNPTKGGTTELTLDERVSNPYCLHKRGNEMTRLTGNEQKTEGVANLPRGPPNVSHLDQG